MRRKSINERRPRNVKLLWIFKKNLKIAIINLINMLVNTKGKYISKREIKDRKMLK